MSDQPRDLAAEVERVATFWGDRPEIKTLLQHIAALARELEEHREALRWALENPVQFKPFKDSYGNRHAFRRPDNNTSWAPIEPPAQLLATLVKAMEGK